MFIRLNFSYCSWFSHSSDVYSLILLIELIFSTVTLAGCIYQFEMVSFFYLQFFNFFAVKFFFSKFFEINFSKPTALILAWLYLSLLYSVSFRICSCIAISEKLPQEAMKILPIACIIATGSNYQTSFKNIWLLWLQWHKSLSFIMDLRLCHWIWKLSQVWSRLHSAHICFSGLWIMNKRRMGFLCNELVFAVIYV